MKVIHLTFNFHPEPMGGTEVYVTGLAKGLLACDIATIIAAPGATTQSYCYDGIPVRRFATRQQVDNLRDLYGEGDELAAHEFAKVLDEEKPDLVHLHAFTPGVSLRSVRAAKLRGIPVVYTYHTPTATCQRGTMMRWGTAPCNGLMNLHDCSRCTLEGLINRKSEVGGLRSHVGKISAQVMGSLPPEIGRLLGKCGLRADAITGLRMTELVRLHHSTTRAMLAEVDHVVAVCDWVRQVLLRNGVPEAKMTLSRQGVTLAPTSRVWKTQIAKAESPTESFVLKIGFFGRLDPTKGIHILLLAIRSIPLAALKLDIYAVSQGAAGRNYELTLRSLANGDDRINFIAPVAATEILATLTNYDLLAVPSQLLETGPLVVLEAFEAGVPVIGSRLGGIAELVDDGVNGILVEPSSVAAWQATLQKLCSEPDLIKHLRSGGKPSRTMQTVTEEMITLYIDIVCTKEWRDVSPPRL